MRLVCPRCAAQYDVPVEAVPPGGRDVQCSSCDSTWYQPQYTPPPDDAVIETAPPQQGGKQAPEAPAPRPRIDPEMAALFAEEREFEQRKRQAEALETQPELGLDAPISDAPLHGGKDKKRLPDANEINQTLRAEKGAGWGNDPRGGIFNRSKFALGFWGVIVLAITACLVYVFAPKISDAMPQAGPALDAYVAKVDQGRFWLNDRLTALGL